MAVLVTGWQSPNAVVDRAAVLHGCGYGDKQRSQVRAGPLADRQYTWRTPEMLIMSVSVVLGLHDDDRARRVVHHVGAHRSQQRTLDRASTPRADDDRVGADLFGRSDDGEAGLPRLYPSLDVEPLRERSNRAVEAGICFFLGADPRCVDDLGCRHAAGEPRLHAARDDRRRVHDAQQGHGVGGGRHAESPLGSVDCVIGTISGDKDLHEGPFVTRSGPVGDGTVVVVWPQGTGPPPLSASFGLSLTGPRDLPSGRVTIRFGAQVANRLALLDTLERHDVGLITPSSMPAAELFSTLRDAELVVGSADGGLAGCLFSSRAHVVELLDDVTLNPEIYYLAASRGLPYDFVPATAAATRRTRSTSVLDIGWLDRLLGRLTA